MTTTTDRPAARPAAAPPRVDVAALENLLLGQYAQLRREARAIATDPDFQKIEGLPLAEHRERVLTQLRRLEAEHDVLRSFPTHLGGADDHGGSLARFEELVAADPSLQIKAGVQWGLFASAILHLGTQHHHDTFLSDAMHLQVPGAFAMTEAGHGSDVASIGTTAQYDPDTEEFVIHTPFRAAWKDYLGNAAVHGTAAVVFAQLITAAPGGPRVNHGVHAFYVPIRDPQSREFLPGIGGEDDGVKGGLNGIDNGRLHFTHVRVPRTNLLNRYGDVAPDGTYSSPIASPGRRFFTMLGTLVQGRVSLDGAAANASKMALAIAVTYGNQRRQFAGGTGDEVVLLDYGQHQRRLLPLVADAYATSFAHDELLAAFDEVFSGRGDTPGNREDLETLAAALKPTSSWNALRTLQTCREACGGAGYMAENRLTGLHADLDVYATFEGDNTVLYQLVAKRLLGDYAKALKVTQADRGDLARFVVDRVTDAALHRTPLVRAVQTLGDLGDARRSVGQLRDTQTQRDLLTDRVETMVAQVAQALAPARKLSPEKAADLFNAHQHELIEAARAHAERVQWEAFTRAVERVEDPGTKQVLTWVRDLFGLTLVERNLAWYLVNGRLSAGRARTVTSYIERLLVRLRPHAQDLVDAFGYGPEHLRAPIASGQERERQDEARAYYRAQRASGDAPIPEKHVTR
ncbi:acyl-CoA dehydrogenase family protein [Cellulomonas wangsupingiae]|uniref:Acyl-CoA dehydrogenase family protein n=1 Tax=Cellulomonas wangsupingiae TaxID=2968085 RepID=A0ABY5K2P7_9CELL|nr:acyl-CoA dehydrogenase [Cellulomonas wangsupingiae]MCC2336638.1 acyl-CoA dehydrogenase family protein [Cellulomonas wangsupingiae]MCM0640520.1 acyl-CoA dehydrogenase family protein [Cellulomonas wangsupingiae]UUI64484.1 acyl-CoA dehydrogenase family protein [Cellulomonas wangsupingiae]